MRSRRPTLTTVGRALAVVSLLVVAAGVCFYAAPARTQTVPAGASTAPAAEDSDNGLTSMIPPQAIFYVERRGHKAVREAFLASNFGKLAMDQAVNQFVHASRVRIGEMMVKQLFDLVGEEDVETYQKALHEMLLPFWYQPAAMYLVVPTDDKGRPESFGFGFVCRTGEYHAACKAAVEKLAAFGVPESGKAGKRQKFSYEHEGLAWEGVAKGHSGWTLPAQAADQPEALDGKTLFMVRWEDDTLLISTSLPVADAMSNLLVARQEAAADATTGKATDKNFRKVLAKTVIKDWAFRWYLDVAMMWDFFSAGVIGEDTQRTLLLLGVDNILGVGGTGGYVDKVYARKTYIYAPETPQGLLRVFKADGSYAKGLAMTPDTASIFLSGQLDAKVLMRMVGALVKPPPDDDEPEGRVRELFQRHDESVGVELAVAEPGGPESDTGDTEGQEDFAAQVVKALEELLAASEGNFSIFLSNIAGVLGPAMMGSVPVGCVLDIKDRDEAKQAIDKLVELAGGEVEEEEEEEQPGRPDATPRADQYRNITIQYLPSVFGRSPTRVAVLDDRVVLAFSDDALKAAIDTALDKTGCYPEDSKGQKLAKLCGDGSAIFAMDLADMAKVFWPMLMEAAEREGFPLANLPSTAKMTRLLGPELAVFKPDEDGLLLDSRGQVPFATKIIPASPVMGGLFFMMMMGGGF